MDNQKYPTRLEDLNKEQLEILGKAVVFDELKEEWKRQESLKAIPGVEILIEKFLERFKSKKTRDVYRFALNSFMAWCRNKSINPVALTTGEADNFTTKVRMEYKNAGTARTIVKSTSSFYSWVGAQFEVDNPFIGSGLVRSLGRKPSNKQSAWFPTIEEMVEILDQVKESDRAAIFALSSLGIPVAALPELVITDQRFSSVYHGKIIKGPCPRQLVILVEKAALTDAKPFSFRDAEGWSVRIKKILTKLYQDGKVSHAFSASDFKDFYAYHEYKKARDILALSRRCGHSYLTSTEQYLRRLGFEI